MTDYTTYLLIAGVVLGVLVLLGILYNLYWWVLGVVHPFTYDGLRPAELADHVHAFVNRGTKGSRFVITCEQTGRQLHLRKSYVYRKPGITVDLEVRGQGLVRSRLSAAAAGLEAMGLQSRVGKEGASRALAVKAISDVQLSVAAACAVAPVLGEEDTCTFSVRLKGNMAPQDRYVGGETTVTDAVAGFWAYPQGRPYNWYQYRHDLDADRKRSFQAGQGFGRFLRKLIK